MEKRIYQKSRKDIIMFLDVKLIFQALIFATFFVVIIWLLQKYPFVITNPMLRFFVYSSTMMIPTLVMILLSYLVKRLGVALFPQATYLILSFIVYFLLYYFIVRLYKKRKPAKRKKFVVILLICIMVYLIISIYFLLRIFYR